MKTIEINIDQLKAPREVSELFKQHRVTKGDEVKLSTSLNEDSFAILAVLLVISLVLYWKSKGKEADFGEDVLAGLFEKYSSVDEIEQEIQREYGIRVSVESRTDAERHVWMKAGMHHSGKAYKPEPDISEVEVKEPNPEFSQN